jgi:hypothetical protein
MVSWDAPETTPLHYNLYRTDRKEVIEIGPEFNSYFEELEPGDYMYKLTAVYEDCESEYALTQTGDDYLFITVTSVPENTSEKIATVTGIYTMSGQRLKTINNKDLSEGLYIVQGLTADGKPLTRKLIVK